MYPDRETSENAGVLAYLCPRGRYAKTSLDGATAFRLDMAIRLSPHIIEYLWETPGARSSRPTAGRWSAISRHWSPRVGDNFRRRAGEEYALRLPPAEFDLAQAAGAELVHRYRTAQVMLDPSVQFGPHWVFGCFDRRESGWCVAALEFAERA